MLGSCRMSGMASVDYGRCSSLGLTIFWESGTGSNVAKKDKEERVRMVTRIILMVDTVLFSQSEVYIDWLASNYVFIFIFTFFFEV